MAKKEYIARIVAISVLVSSIFILVGSSYQVNAVFQSGNNDPAKAVQSNSGVSIEVVQQSICEGHQYGGKEWTEAEKAQACSRYEELTGKDSAGLKAFNKKPIIETTSDSNRQHQINRQLIEIAVPTIIVLASIGTILLVFRNHAHKVKRKQKK